MTISTASANLKFSNSDTGAGVSPLVVHVDAGQTAAIFYVQGFADTGTSTFTASARATCPKMPSPRTSPPES